MPTSVKGGNLILEDVSIDKSVVDPGEQVTISARVTNGAAAILITDPDRCDNGANPCGGGGLFTSKGYCFNLRAAGNGIRDAETGPTCIDMVAIGTNSKEFEFTFDAPLADGDMTAGVFLELPGSGTQSEIIPLNYRVRAGETNQSPTLNITDVNISNGEAEPVFNADDPDGNLPMAEWTLFKDGQQIDRVEGFRPTLDLAGSGQYRIDGWVEDDDGARANDTIGFPYQAEDPDGNRDPTIQVTGVTGGPGNISPTYNATDPDGDSLNYEWTVNLDGNTVATSTSANPTFDVVEPGQYFLDVVVNDGKGGSDTSFDRFTIEETGNGGDNRPPSVVINDVSVMDNRLIPEFSVSDPDNNIATHRWELLQNGRVVQAFNQRSPDFSRPPAGTYTLSYVVTDQQGAQGSDSAEVTVQEQQPENGNGGEQPGGDGGIDPRLIAGGVALVGGGLAVTMMGDDNGNNTNRNKR